MESILITINLLGRVNGCVKHTDYQKVKVNVSKPTEKFSKIIEKKILFTDRKDSVCVQKTRIEENVLKHWSSHECPYWEKSNHWKNMSKKQRIESYVKRFDEGYGVSYQ